MNIYIDCEWNGYRGDLISMALVADNGEEFYEVLPCSTPVQWIAENVMPILNKEPITATTFTVKLGNFLNQFDRVHVIADWPEDIERFCRQLILDAGMCINTPPLTMEIVRINSESKLPHNALEDARDLMHAYVTEKYENHR